MRALSFKNITNIYTQTVLKNCLQQANEVNGLSYWQNRLFGFILIYLLPLSLLAIIPGIIMSLKNEIPFLAVYDFIIIFLLAFIAFAKGLSVAIRKAVFITIIYISAIVLLYFLGSYGPGLLYIMAATVFTIIIFNRQIAYLSVLINLLICIFFGISIYLKKTSGIIVAENSIGGWIAIASNLILLSFILTAILPTLFKSLQNTIEEQQKLRMQVKIEQRSLEKTLTIIQQKNKELEEFSYMTSHDLQEPLRMITGLLQQLDKNYKKDLDEKAQQYIHLAIDGADRMKKIISDLLDYSVAEKKPNTFEEVDTNAILESFIKDNSEVIAEKKANLSWNDLPNIQADKLCVMQLFQNLIGNALKYQRNGQTPSISIQHKETKKHWAFAFSDNGIGIATEDQDKVFAVFKRLHDRSEYPGTGIGLAICKKIVENHRGKIWIESELGKGSTFHFTISKKLN
jgi:signal transduction histidine kinase